MDFRRVILILKFINFRINDVDFTNNLTDREIEQHEQEFELEKKKFVKLLQEENKADKKKPIKKISTSFEKPDITRKVNRTNTLKVSVNPLRHHMDLQDHLNNNKNIVNVNTKKDPPKEKKVESSKNVGHKFNLRKSLTVSDQVINNFKKSDK